MADEQGPPETALREQLAANLAAVEQEVVAACQSAGRPRDSVQLIAVTKSAPEACLPVLATLGVTAMGESRPQQFARRTQLVPAVEWHLIGHLQRNKIDLVLPVAALIHSVDSDRLFAALSAAAAKQQRRLPILLEVNVSGEASKSGFTPADVLERIQTWTADPHLDVRGLMTMAPLDDQPETARPVFRGLRTLRDELRSRLSDPAALPELSMGMSGDFAVAIEEGATLIRVGSRLFQGLPSS